MKLFPNTKSEWPEGLGQLTPLGKRQHYDLGQKFRHRYMVEHQLLNSTYHINEVYARSTSIDRTLMSAQVRPLLHPLPKLLLSPPTSLLSCQSFLYGLFPPDLTETVIPFGLQVVPVHAVARHEDTLLYAYKNCPRLDELTALSRARYA